MRACLAAVPLILLVLVIMLVDGERWLPLGLFRQADALAADVARKRALRALPNQVATIQTRLAARDRALFESPPAMWPVAEEVRAAFAGHVADGLKARDAESNVIRQRFGHVDPPAAPLSAGASALRPLSTGTLVVGDILTDTTWTLAGSPYVLTNTIAITGGAVLTIEAGVTVRFDAMRTIGVSSRSGLRALGTPSAPITFTGAVAQPGAWNSVMFSPGSSGRLSYTSILYAGASEPAAKYQAGLGIYSPDVVLDHTTVAYSAGYPLFLWELPVFGEGNVFRDNARSAILLTLAMIVPDRTARMPNYGIPYEVSMGIGVYGTLVVDPGVTMRFGAGGYFAVWPFGHLLAAGTADQRITFTSSSPVPMPGDWTGIYFDDRSQGRLEYALVEYAGRVGTSAVTVVRASPSIRNTTIARNILWPLYVMYPASFPILAELEIVDNGHQGIFVERQTIVDAPQTIRIPRLAVPYYVRGLALKRSTLAIEPGAWLEFEPLADIAEPAGLTIGAGARLEAAGSFTRPITMTIRATTMSASGRAAGSHPTVPAAAVSESWPGIQLTDPSAVGTISHTRVERAGQYFGASIASFGAALTLTGSRITEGSGAAVQVTTDAGAPGRVTLIGNTLDRHDYGLVRSTAGATPDLVSGSAPAVTMYHNNVVDNRIAGVVNADAGASVDARLNWWGNAAGPAASDVGGTGVDAQRPLIAGVRVPAAAAVLSGTVTLEALDASVRVAVPSGAIQADVLYLSPLAGSAAGSPGLVATDYAFAADALSGQTIVTGTFARPVTLTIPIDPTRLGGLDLAGLRLFTWSPASQSWEVVPGSAYDPASGAVVATTDHFTEFQVFSVSAPTATPTPTPTPTRTTQPTPTPTATPTAAAGAWLTLLSEGFEGNFPEDNRWWLLGSPTWNDVTCQAHQGSRSGWPAGSLDNCAGNYRNSQNSWMIWGPFSLADATQARLDFRLLLDAEHGYDWLQVRVSTDGNLFYGIQNWTGSAGVWQAQSVDLASAPLLGRLLGQVRVWIAFRFSSDSNGTRRGPYIDDVELKVFIPAGVPIPTATATATWTGGTPTPTRTSSATPTASPTRTAAHPGWTTVLYEGFEGAFPQANRWRLVGDPTWNDVACFASSGNRSGWPAGSTDDCAGSYRDDRTAWMIWGPFSLADVSQARLDFDLLLDTEENLDWLYVRASVDGSSFYPIRQWSGSSNGRWAAQSLDLAEVPGIGGLIGRSQVWIAFHFFANYATSMRGPYVDEIELSVVAQRSPTPTPTPTSTPPPRLGSLSVANATDTSFSVVWTTDAPAVGFVRYGITTTAGTRTQIGVVPDVRGAGFVGRTHFVQVGGVDPATGRPSAYHNLDPDAEYWIEVLGADPGEPLAHRTARTGVFLGQYEPAARFGSVRDGLGNPVPDALVLATLVDADGLPSSGEATLLATAPNAEGLWFLDLRRARTADLAGPFVYGDADRLRLVADAGSSGTALITVTVGTAPPLLLTVEPVATHTFSYGPGWNAVALPMRPLTVGTLADLARHLNGDGKVRLTQAYRYAEGAWEGATLAGTTVVGTDFALTPGEGYFLAMAGQGTWDLAGYVAAEPPTITLRTGWNLVGMPVAASRLHASDIVASARESYTGGYRVAEAHRWIFGSYEAYVAGYPLNDFRIAPDRAYFLKATTGFAWRAPLPGNGTMSAVGW